MIGEFNRSVLLTYLGACCSVIGMGLCMLGSLKYAVVCMIVAGICDLFDGVIARKCKRGEAAQQFGIQIDSLTDMISFVAFPVVMGMRMMQTLGWGAWIVLSLYTLAGIIRLAWYNVHTASEQSVHYFAGLPVTYIALILPVCYLFWGYMSEPAFGVMTGGVFLVVALLFVLKVKICKPRGIWYAVFGLLAVALIVLSIWIGV
ncbi:MAG TPA: CDP-alcohol phosphatidyltransferase family protein [Lachnospiraceae bacterium]|nr:CDP-alcohol phosphatidyltransferase family protein [Lachnospiraceae bacterium]